MRRKRSPLAYIAAIIAVAVAAWITNGFEQSKPSQMQPQPEPRVEAKAQRVDNEQIQIKATLDLIARGGPFPHRQDGSTFQNREGHLPSKPRGYYREYTVPTPGASNRGARRIVRGQDGDTWYTRDHYKSFIRLD
jgi:ribonuclease T1